MFRNTYKTSVLFKHTLLKIVMGVFAMAAIAYGGFVVPAGRAYAATNNTVNFQARLEGASGNISADGYYNIQFKLYSVSSGGSALWTESYYDTNGVTAGNDFRVQVINGYVSVPLGSQTAFPTTINWDQDLYITMNVGGTVQTATPTYDGEMNPRLKLGGVPYAFKAGQLAQYNATSGFTSTLSLLQPTVGNQDFQIADQGASGTYTLCVQGSSSCGFASSTGSGNYIQNSTSLQSGANFNISGTGIAATALQTPSLDTASSGTLTIGATNATTISLNQNTTVTTGHTLKVADGLIGTPAIIFGTGNLGIYTTASGDTLNIINGASTGIASFSRISESQISSTVGVVAARLRVDNSGGAGQAFLLQNGGATLTQINNNGSTSIRTAANMNGAFQVQNANGTSLFNADTLNGQVISSGNLNTGTTYGNRVLSDGFESGNLSQWSNQTGVIGTDTSVVHNGKYSTKVVSSASSSYVDTLYTATNTVTARAYVYATSQASGGSGNLFAVYSGGTGQFSVYRQSTTGYLCTYRSILPGSVCSTTTVLPLNTWTKIELTVSIDPTVGSQVLKMNDVVVSDASSTGINTGSVLLTKMVIGAYATQTNTYWIDDVAVDTTATGDSGNLNVSDSLHVGGSSSFGSSVYIQNTAGTSLLSADTAKMQITTNGNVSVGTLAGARNFSDDFEAANFSKWTLGTTGTVTADTVQVHNGKYAAKTVSSSSASYVASGLTAGGTLTARYWAYASSTPTADADMFGLSNIATGFSGSQVSVYRQATTGYLCVYRGAGAGGVCSTTTFPTGQWNMIELSVVAATGATGSASLKLNGVAVSGASFTASSTGATTFDRLYVGNSNSVTQTMWFDDLAVDASSNLGTGSSLNVQDSLHVGGSSSFGSSVQIQSAASSTAAFQVQNAAGTNLFNVNASTMEISTNVGTFSVNGVANPATPTLTTASTGGSLAAGTYLYRLAAIGANGTYTVAVASTPGSVTTTGSTSQNTLSWTTVANATSYRIYRSSNGGTSWFTNSVANSFTSIIDNGSTYTWTTALTPQFDLNDTGGIKLQRDTVLYVDAGTGSSLSGLKYQSAYGSTTLFNNNSGGTINLQSDSFRVSDTTGYNTNLSISNTGAASFLNRANSANAFQIQNASSAQLFNVDTSTSTITIGNATNNVTFSAATFEPVLNGTARHAKSLLLAPEYTNAVLDAGTGTANVGAMTSGIDLTNRMNYYKWTTTQATTQSYDVDVQYQLPSDFATWGTTPLSVTAYTTNNSTGTIKLETRDTTGAVICNFVDVTPGSTSTWATNSTACTMSTGTYTAGGYITLRLRLYSPQNGDTRVGNVVLNYLSKY